MQSVSLSSFIDAGVRYTRPLLTMASMDIAALGALPVGAPHSFY